MLQWEMTQAFQTSEGHIRADLWSLLPFQQLLSRLFLVGSQLGKVYWGKPAPQCFLNLPVDKTYLSHFVGNPGLHLISTAIDSLGKGAWKLHFHKHLK